MKKIKQPKATRTSGILRKFFRLLVGSISLVLIAVVALMTAAIIWPLGQPVPPARDDRLIITNAMIVDVAGGDIQGPTNIHIRDGLISHIGGNAPDAGSRVIDITGNYVIPGLFDMHFHSTKFAPFFSHPLLVASGVTSVRDMGGCLGRPDSWAACIDDKRDWHTQAEKGAHVGPKYEIITSLPVNGGSEIPPDFDVRLGASTPEGARLRAEHDAARGIDFLKTYSDLPAESYFALADAAGDQGLYLAGHLPFSVSAMQAISAGQRSFEHGLLFVWECFEGIEKLRQTADPLGIYDNALRLEMLEKHDSAACVELMSAMAEKNVAFVPTHTTRKLDALAADEAFLTDARLKYIPGPLRMMWRQDARNMANRGTADGSHSYLEIYQLGLELTGQAFKEGVTILAGTDAPDSYAFPGLGLADELEHLVAAGLSPLEALQAATIAPAKFLGLEGRAGVVASGARADLVILGRNPVHDVAAIRDIYGVMHSGTYYDRTAIDRLLNLVERNANSWTLYPKFAWAMLLSPIMRTQFGD